MYQPTYSFSMPKPYHSIDMPKTFPEDIECIIKGKTTDAGSLYISNVQAASNPNTLKKLKITAVLSCAKGYELKHPKTVVPHYRYIPTEDKDECDISIHFDEAVAFIQQKLRHTNVLVHCIAGVSRSVSMVLAYFIKQHNMHYDEAYRLVKSKRNIIHPNDGFIRQLKKYSDTLKTQQKNARKGHDVPDASPRAMLQSVTFRMRQNNFLDKTTSDFKSIQLSPHRETTPKKVPISRGGDLYDRYSSAQLKTPPPSHKPISFTRDQPFQSLQHIPDEQMNRESTLTPKAKNEPIRPQRYDLMRTSTNYFTPNKTLINQKPYESIRRYQDYAKSTKLERPTTSPINKPHLSPNRINQTIDAHNDKTMNRFNQPQYINRGDYFASKNSELNEKIDLIRKKYAAEREKLLNKYQSPQKQRPEQFNQPLLQQANEKRRVSLGEYRTERPILSSASPAVNRPSYDYIQQQKKYEFSRTDTKQQPYKKTTNYESYGELYSKKYEKVGNMALNEEESFSTRADKTYRASLYDNTQQRNREYDRLAGLGGPQYGGYAGYTPYYKYGSTYKRYY